MIPGKGEPRLSDTQSEAVCEVTVPNEQGLHLRPVTAFVDLAARYKSTVSVKNVTRDMPLRP